jgi:hypothetical protein
MVARSKSISKAASSTASTARPFKKAKRHAAGVVKGGKRTSRSVAKSVGPRAVAIKMVPTDRGGNFAISLLGRDGNLVVEFMAKIFLITKTQLAETAGLPRDAVYKPARIRAIKTQARLGEMVEILRRVEEWAGGPRHAMLWYKSEPIPAFGGRTPEALVKTGYAASLLDYLDNIGTGGYA